MGRLYMNWFSDKIDSIDESTPVTTTTTTVKNPQGKEIVIGDAIGAFVEKCSFLQRLCRAVVPVPVGWLMVFGPVFSFC